MQDYSFDNIVINKIFHGKGAINHSDAKTYLRHDHPMLGVDRIVDHDFENGWVHAIRGISCSHPAFQGHFKDLAIYPGTTLCQDVIQVCILLFIGATGKLQTDIKNKELTVVSSLQTNIGHPVPPGSLLDIVVWTTKRTGNRSMSFKFDIRMRDFKFYLEPTRYGLKFSSALYGETKIVKVKKKIYDEIGL